MGRSSVTRPSATEEHQAMLSAAAALLRFIGSLRRAAREASRSDSSRPLRRSSVGNAPLSRTATMMRDLAKAAMVALLAPGMAIANGEAKFGFQTPQTIVAHEIYDL